MERFSSHQWTEVSEELLKLVMQIVSCFCSWFYLNEPRIDRCCILYQQVSVQYLHLQHYTALNVEFTTIRRYNIVREKRMALP